MYNASKLTNEMQQGGIDVSGCSEDGKVWDMFNNEIQDRADVAAIIAAHDPTDAPIYSISLKSDVIAIGDTLEISVTGAAGDYVLIIEGLAVPEQQITIDETGVEIIELPAIDAGTYYIKGTGLLSLCVAKVEVI